MKKAGIPLNEEAQKALEDDEVDVYDLDKFNICIAMFSRFKLDTLFIGLMLRLVGFGDNAGSGFPTILDVWKSEGWIKPQLIEDTNLDQVTLVMKMEKESDDKSAEKSAESAEKSADLKNREGMMLSERHQQILAIMEAGVEYSTEQVAEKIGLKGPRTRQLLNELVNKELLACIGTTKRRRYIKPVD